MVDTIKLETRPITEKYHHSSITVTKNKYDLPKWFLHAGLLATGLYSNSWNNFSMILLLDVLWYKLLIICFLTKELTNSGKD